MSCSSNAQRRVQRTANGENMAHSDLGVQVETVVRIEKELEEARRRASQALREAREERRISLRQAAKGVRLSPAALSMLERGETWHSRTAMRAARFLDRTDSAA